MKIIFSLFLFFVLCLCDDILLLRFKNGAGVNIPVNSNIISILSPSLHQDALAQKSSYYCHCCLEEWVAFMRLALEDDFQVDLQVNDVIKNEFLELRARISAYASDKNKLKRILLKEGHSTCQLSSSSLVELWFWEFRMFFKIIAYRNPADTLNTSLTVYQIYDGSQFYIECPFDSFREIHRKYPYINDDGITLKPQSIFRFHTNFRDNIYLIGPVDSAFNAELVELSLLDLHNFFKRMQALSVVFRNRQIPSESARIEIYLFLNQGKIRIALPMLYRDQFPFKNSIEILNQLIELLPRYKQLIESYKIRIFNEYGTLIERGNHRELAASSEKSRFFVGLYETIRQDYLKSILKDARNNRIARSNAHNRQSGVNRAVPVEEEEQEQEQEEEENQADEELREIEAQIEEEKAEQNAQIDHEMQFIGESDEEYEPILVIDEDAEQDVGMNQDAEQDVGMNQDVEQDVGMNQDVEQDVEMNQDDE